MSLKTTPIELYNGSNNPLNDYVASQSQGAGPVGKFYGQMSNAVSDGKVFANGILQVCVDNAGVEEVFVTVSINGVIDVDQLIADNFNEAFIGTRVLVVPTPEAELVVQTQSTEGLGFGMLGLKRTDGSPIAAGIGWTPSENKITAIVGQAKVEIGFDPVDSTGNSDKVSIVSEGVEQEHPLTTS